jgi:hypothetical protein
VGQGHQCPLQQSILLSQGLIHKIFTNKYWELAELENELFSVVNFDFFFQIFFPMKITLAFLYEVSLFSALWMVSSESWKKTSSELICTRLYQSQIVAKAPCDLQPHYGNGVFGNVYILALDNTKR